MENSILMKKSYSKYALGAFIFLMGTMGLQFFSGLVLEDHLPESFVNSSTFSFLNIIIPEYVVGFPLFILFTRKMESQAPEKNTYTAKNFFSNLVMMATLIGIGMIVGLIVHSSLLKAMGTNMLENQGIAGLILNSSPFWRILTIGFLAPIVEELVFRKFLIDRICKYGEAVAIVTSGLMFGLFHGNFQQFFFATLMGMFLAYIYVRTGKIWITIAYHMILNLATSVISVGILSTIDIEKMSEMTDLAKQVTATGGQDADLMQRYTDILTEVMPSLVLYYGWLGFMGLLALIGLVVWILKLKNKNLQLQSTEEQVNGGFRFAWCNTGMILFVIGTISLFVINYALINA